MKNLNKHLRCQEALFFMMADQIEARLAAAQRQV
jgi:hypothetical protein